MSRQARDKPQLSPKSSAIYLPVPIEIAVSSNCNCLRPFPYSGSNFVSEAERYDCLSAILEPPSRIPAASRLRRKLFLRLPEVMSCFAVPKPPLCLFAVYQLSLTTKR
jgi:hypothetical protein